MGDQLYVSHSTVKAHSRALSRKLDVSTCEQAVEIARGHGLLAP